MQVRKTSLRLNNTGTEKESSACIPEPPSESSSSSSPSSPPDSTGSTYAHATEHNARAPAEWVYAEMIVCFSVTTCVVHALVTVKRVTWCLWDGVLFIFWLAQVGVFGSIYYASPIKAEYEGFTKCVPRMKAAVWIDLVNVLLWFSTFVLGGGLVYSCSEDHSPYG
jgi:hypothetical protein